MDADTWEEDMTYASYGYFIEDMGMLIHWSSDRVLISMHEMYPPILGYFCPSGKKDFLKLIPKWNKKEKVWAVKHQSSECSGSQLEFSVHPPSTDIATSRSGKKKEKKTCAGTRHALQGGLNKGYNTLLSFVSEKKLELLRSQIGVFLPGGAGGQPYNCAILWWCEGYSLQAVYSWIGYVNQSVWVYNKVSFSWKLISYWLKIVA